MQNVDDPYLAFVPGQPLIFAAERGRSVIFLRYPDLQVDRPLDVPTDRRLEVIKGSPDGTWIAGFFEESSFRVAGKLRVWNVATGQASLVLDDASMAFNFLDDNRLIAWQPKSGITQWELSATEAKQVGVVVAPENSVFRDNMYPSPDRRYLLIKGTCRGGEANSKTDWWDYCVYDLSNGSTVGWAEDPESATAWNKTGKFTRQFTELLIGANIDSTFGMRQSNCKKVGPTRELCNDGAAVTLVETTEATVTSPPPAPKEAPKEAPARPKFGLNFKEMARQIKEASQAIAADAQTYRATLNSAGRNRRILWAIRAGEEIGRHINSCALSADGRWVAVGSMGVTVSLFDTEHLEPKKNLMNGEWQEPVMVKQFEMP